MSVQKIGNVVAGIRGAGPQDRTNWVRLGTAFKTEDGSIRLKLDALPISKDWDGWCSVFPEDGAGRQAGRNGTGQRAPGPVDDIDTIPF